MSEATVKSGKAYRFHGVELEETAEDNHTGECPFCAKPKFAVNVTNGLFRCWVCGEQGGIGEFLRQLHRVGVTSTTRKDLEELAEDSELPSTAVNTFRDWEVIKHPITGEWAIPGYHWLREFDARGKSKYKVTMGGLYVHRKVQKKDGSYGYVLMSSPGVNHTMIGLDSLKFKKKTGEPDHDTMVITEGWRDGMTLRFALDQPGTPTSMVEWGVVSIPGTQVFKPVWTTLFRQKHVVILYDNDHPTDINGTLKQQGGPMGTTKIGSILLSQRPEDRPLSIRYLGWGMDYPNEFNPEVKSGMDLRDLFIANK